MKNKKQERNENAIKHKSMRRERTMELLRQQEEEKAIEICELWGKVKENERIDKTELNKNKIRLQLKLIAAQDKLFKERQVELKESEKKLRLTDRAKKNEQRNALQNICKQSLENDRLNKSRTKKRNNDNNQKQHENNSNNVESNVNMNNVENCNDICDFDITVTNVSNIDVKQPNVSLSKTLDDEENNALSNNETVLNQLMNEISIDSANLIADITEEDEDGSEFSVPQAENKEWFTKQLHDLFGEQEAEYFLHPKMAQRVCKPVNPKLHSYGGHSGVKTLWAALRNESNKKLIKEDEKIPDELKMAYSAFIREAMENKWNPVKRSFYAKDDVPELKRLMDGSKLERANVKRYRAGLMYRASTMNEDKSKVLLHNKNMTEYSKENDNENDSDCGVSRFIPLTSDNDEDCSDYKKWINSPLNIEIAENISKKSRNDVELLLTATRGCERFPRPVKSLPPLKFLTEKDTTVEGQFTKHYKDKKYDKKMSESVINQSNCTKNLPSIVKNQKGKNILTGVSFEEDERKIEIWQPLSMNALAEYSKQKNVIGIGKFAQGSMKYWNMQSLPAIETTN